MLPSEQFELAIYRWVKSVGIARPVNIPDFYVMPGSNGQYALVVERLKDLYAHGYIGLSKISGNYSVPYNKFAPIEGENAFFGGSFVVEIAPAGRKFFETLEVREEREKQVQQESKSTTFDAPRALDPGERVVPTPAKDAQPSKTADSQAKRWDVFISHASEDKGSIAHPLAVALRDRGLEVWYDAFTLKLGDSLRASIDRGLAESQFGVVILSKHFFAKHWPQQELNGLAAIEVSGRKVILPVWHGVTREDVAQYSPMLADKKAVSTDAGFERVIEAILQVVDPGSANSTVYGETNDLHIGTRVHVRKQIPGVPREQWPFDSEVYVIRKTDEQKKTAIARPVFPPFDRPTPTVEGPMSGPHSPFKRANIPS